MVHIELDGWQRNDTVRGQPPKPLDWKTVVPECDPNVTWPFDPRVDAAQKELAVGMYVQVTGSLVTDEPHSQEDQLITNMILRLGLPATINWVTANRPGDTTSVPRGANNAAKWIWSDGLTNNARAHPCRWNEIHSPDYFRVIDERQPSRVLQMVAVCAQNGLFSGDVNHFAVDLQGPANRPANTVLAWRSHDTQWTRASSVKSGPTVTVADGHITVDVTVQGDSAMGHSGTFCEIYELWWQPAVRRINVPTVSVAVLDQPVTITVSAADSATGAPIAGDVFMDGNRVAAVGQTFSWTFGSHMEWVVDTGPDGKPRRYRVRVADPVDGHVAAAGYLHGPIVFDLPVGDL
jgi:hypothetical protein